jgi:hypothetical protein
MKTLNEQYRLIKNDKGHKDVFLKEAKRIYPNFITNSSTFNEASKILKNKGIISENFVGMSPINNPFGDKKQEGYEKAFEKFIKEATEAKAEEKKVSKEVEEDQKRTYDNKDKKDPNNMIFGQIQMGYYNELKNPKNADKTEQEIKDIVFKNLEKDPIYYTTHGQFGEEDLGYTDEAPSLGEPKEPKGPYKSSGYGTLKENKSRRRKLLKEENDDVGMINYLKSLPDQYDMSNSQYDLWEDIIESIEGFTSQEIKNYIKDLPNLWDMSDSQYDLWEDIIDNFDLKKYLAENKLLNEHSISMAGGIVTGDGFTSQNYMDFYGLNEDDTQNAADRQKDLEDIKKSKEEIASIEMFKEDDDLENRDEIEVSKEFSPHEHLDSMMAGNKIKNVVFDGKSFAIILEGGMYVAFDTDKSSYGNASRLNLKP